MGTVWVVILVAFAGLYFGDGLPLKSAPPFYPRDSNDSPPSQWGYEGGVYATVPALALVLTAIGLVFGCTWCYRHKDCKPNEGAENQLFASSVAHLHDARRSNPPDSGFSEPANNNISEDNNNGPISLREMQNIANNNAAAYIVSDNEERNRVSRESVVEFEPLPVGIRVDDPLERCADWFGEDDIQRSSLQYLREIGRGWFGRVVEGELEGEEGGNLVAVKILNQTASLEDKARFLDEAKLYRDCRHENILPLLGKCLQEDPWILLFELCPMDLQQYLVVNRDSMTALMEAGVPLRIVCDVTNGLTYLHSRGFLYGNLWSGTVTVRGASESGRGVLGSLVGVHAPVEHHYRAPEVELQPQQYTQWSEVWSLGALLWEVCMWGAPVPRNPPPPDLPPFYRNHLYQVMQLCWQSAPASRPTSQQVHAMLLHLMQAQSQGGDEFERRWQVLKPNTIPKLDEHVAIVHAPSTSTASHFTGSQDLSTHDTLSVDLTAVSRSSSMMSDKDPLSVQIKSESLTNLHGSLEDVRNIYLTHNEAALLECHQANTALDDSKDKDNDRFDSSVDPWLKDIIAGSHDDVSYYKDVSDVIKNLDNILNSEKTSSSESSHQASPSRDNLSLDCKKDFPTQSSMVKSPGIRNFQNIVDVSSDVNDTEPCDDEFDRDTVGTLSHSFERHSDTISQQTLENLTPDTPIKDVDIVVEVENETTVPDPDLVKDTLVDKKIEEFQQKELPNENNVETSVNLPSLRELCAASMPSVSDNIEQLIKDCKAPCDTLSKIVRTEETELKIENKPPNVQSTVVEQLRTKLEENQEQNEINTQHEIILPDIQDKESESNETSREEVVKGSESKIAILCTDKPIKQTESDKISHSNEIFQSDVVSDLSKQINSIIEEALVTTSAQEIANNSLSPVISENLTSETKSDINSYMNANKENDLKEPSNTEVNGLALNRNTQDLASMNLQTAEDNIEKTHTILFTEIPDTVQNEFNSHFNSKILNENEHLDNSQNNSLNSKSSDKEEKELTLNIVGEEVFDLNSCNLGTSQSQATVVNDKSDDTLKIDSIDSTAYMDLTSNTNIQNSKIDRFKDDVTNNFSSYMAEQNVEVSVERNESTVYLDLPNVIEDSDSFLQSEKWYNSRYAEPNKIVASTPKGTDSSAENTLEHTTKNESDLSETKIPDTPDYGPGLSLTKLEQKYVPDYIVSPLESPTKSHHTDTYEENSSVVLGPFENCTLELFKGVKSTPEMVDMQKEELLAFSSNFNEINLETPSPLRDGKFLMEVPDILPDDVFDDLETISEPKQPHEAVKPKILTAEDHLSPSTPPNSPGNFLASTSQQKYVVDIDLDQPETSESSNLQNEIELNQIELQITSKLAMAENENNMNIEYSGPMSMDGLMNDYMIDSLESYAIPESYLAGNVGSENVREELTLDEESMAALRNELELKLPLAQVSAIEPQVEAEWSSELPPPPELIVKYPGALSPIQEETGLQLSAYENDINWNFSTRTESSESYPEPCNLSTDEVTELPTGNCGHEQSTYTLHSPDNSLNLTFTMQKDKTTSKDLTMSADSLNGGPYKKPVVDVLSPLDDRTYNKEEVESQRERISQISPFILSPTTETSAPESVENVTGVSTLSRTTVPTDAKLSKPSETQCLSKATSIDSWCSNDTLYNVEENFDDLAMDPDIPLDFEQEKHDEHSESSHTLTHNEDDKETSHCSTYIIHDSKSDACDTFSPDSITANENNTYTKVKTEPELISTSGITKTDQLDSAKDTQTKDLAYKTMISGVPSYSNCRTEVNSETTALWRVPQPELVRQSLICDNIKVMSPKDEGLVSEDIESPNFKLDPCVKKMDSVEITCLQDNILDSQNQSDHVDNQSLISIEASDSPNFCYRNIGHSATSTPLVEIGTDENVEAIPMFLPDTSAMPEIEVPSFQTFLYSAELRPQDLSSNANHENSEGSEGKGKSLNVMSNKDTTTNLERTPTYSDFEISAAMKPQEVSSLNKSSQNVESGTSLEDFRQFESSVKNKPQDLSSAMDAKDTTTNLERTPTYSDFEISAAMKPQEVSSLNKSSQNVESGTSLEDFRQFESSVKNKPQDLSSAMDAKDTTTNLERTPTYSDFEISAAMKPQEVSSLNKSSQNVESGTSLEDFRQFESSVKNKPQDLSSAMDAKDTTTNLERTPTYSDFEISAAMKPQEVSSLNKSSQNVESGTSLEDFRQFESSVKNKPQDLSSAMDAKDTTTNLDRTPTYPDFEISAAMKPQEVSSLNKSSQNVESGISLEDFRQFESSIKNKPQDLSSVMDASSLFLNSERRSNEQAITTSANLDLDLTSHSANQICVTTPILTISPPSISNLIESHNNKVPVNIYVTDIDAEDENEQPHSIIVTDVPIEVCQETPNRTNDSHKESHPAELNYTYDSHKESHPAELNYTYDSHKESHPAELNYTYDSQKESHPAEPNYTCDSHKESHPAELNYTYDSHKESHPVELNYTYDSHKESHPAELNYTYDSHKESHPAELNYTYDSDASRFQSLDVNPDVSPAFKINGVVENSETSEKSAKTEPVDEQDDLVRPSNIIIDSIFEVESTTPQSKETSGKEGENPQCNGDSANFATVNFLSEAFEELLESNVDDSDFNAKPSYETKTDKTEPVAKSPIEERETPNIEIAVDSHEISEVDDQIDTEPVYVNKTSDFVENGKKMVSDTHDFLQNEKIYCNNIDSFIPLLTDIRFTGPADEIMSTSFTQDSPTEPTPHECKQDKKPDSAADILKDWDSDTDSHSSNSSSGEFIWKDGDGKETSVVPTTQFDHQRGSSGGSAEQCPAASEEAGGSGSGSEGDEVEFVPSSWDCRAAPSKSSLRSLEQAAPDNKKRVVFKRQKYHCVYEYPREIADVDADSPATYLPDRSTYSEWDSASAVEAELDYGQLYGAPHPLHLFPQKYRPELPYGADYEEDFYISSSARPFECLGVVPSSQFFPGMSLRALQDVYNPHTTLSQPTLDFTTPDSGVEDITPGSLANDDEYKKKLPESDVQSWRATDSASSSESVSPSSPGGEALGGLRHTRDKLKLDLSPSPHLPSPRHGKIFNFVLDKPKRQAPESSTTPLVMTDDTPVVTSALPMPETEDLDLPEPTFSTFGKAVQKTEPEQKIVLTDEETDNETVIVVNEESEERVKETGEKVKGEGTVLDSGDEDSGIESTKATLERKSPSNVS